MIELECQVVLISFTLSKSCLYSVIEYLIEFFECFSFISNYNLNKGFPINTWCFYGAYNRFVYLQN